MRSASHIPLILAPIGHAVLSSVHLIALGLMTGAPLHAQTLPTSLPGGELRTTLKSSPRLVENQLEGPGYEVPTFVYGDLITGRTNIETTLEGRAELRRGKTSLRADRLEYFQPDDRVKTRGNVRISHSGNLFWGPELTLKIDTFEGVFTQPNYRFLAGGNGQASQIIFVDDKHFVANQATYTTCERGNENSWMPDWQMTGERFAFDFDKEIGIATGATLRFKDVPILHWPGSLSFPLSDKRKSGVMPPSFAVDSISGLAVTAPYYFDIAPNRDATLTPTYASKRGVNLAGEFRYLEPGYRGSLRASYLPSDMLRTEDRWSLGYQHNGVINTGLSSIGNVGVGLTLNRVSDDNYWRDFSAFGGTSLTGSSLGGASGGSTSLTQRLLNNDLNLTWGQGFLNTSFRVQKWQALQDLASPIVPPYDRLPQITARYARSNVLLGSVSGVDWSLDGDFTGFSAASIPSYFPTNGQRAFARVEISRPFLWPAGYITPKLQLRATSYQFDAPLTTAGGVGLTSANVVVPTFSLDAGLQFERDASYFGRSFTQTLEPRAFYVRTPYRNQNFLPNYDSGDNSFNFATVFTENAFAGNDRVSDANLLTLGLTSRLLDPASGAELMRFGVAQRLRFEDQLVALPGAEPVTDRLSDLLLGATANWTREWSVDATTQYNPKLGEVERSSVSARYSPSNYRVINVSYLKQVGVGVGASDQRGISWQWPINDLWGDKGEDLGAGRGQGGGRWYSVGRLNYSMFDKMLVNSVVGFEYDGCCWIGRVVLQRTQSAIAVGYSQPGNTQIMFQLEFVGFARIGENPLQALRANIPKYQLLREQTTPPSRFTNYD